MNDPEKLGKEIEKRLAKLAGVPPKLKAHPMFTMADYNYLKGKGYDDAEIEKIWDKDKASGAKGGQEHTNKPWRQD